MPVTVEEFRYPSATGLSDIYAKIWKPEKAPEAILQISHGMAEHIDRYHAFATYLTEHGILVAANDHAGHGRSMPEGGTPGYFGRQNGWSNVLADNKKLHDLVAARYPDIPYILMGHSLGSFLARTYASRHGEEVDAFIFSGTAGRNPALPVGKLIGRQQLKEKGEKVPSQILHNMSFGSYNKAFAPNRTASDWLSTDTAVVDAYVADPLCGFVFTTEAMLDMFTGMEEINGKAWASKVPDKPILLLSGAEDPVGANGKGVFQVAGWLKKTGHTAISLKLYPNGRHEMLNETNREEVFQDILLFIRSVIQ